MANLVGKIGPFGKRHGNLFLIKGGSILFAALQAKMEMEKERE